MTDCKGGECKKDDACYIVTSNRRRVYSNFPFRGYAHDEKTWEQEFFVDVMVGEKNFRQFALRQRMIQNEYGTDAPETGDWSTAIAWAKSGTPETLARSLIDEGLENDLALGEDFVSEPSEAGGRWISMTIVRHCHNATVVSGHPIGTAQKPRLHADEQATAINPITSLFRRNTLAGPNATRAAPLRNSPRTWRGRAFAAMLIQRMRRGQVGRQAAHAQGARFYAPPSPGKRSRRGSITGRGYRRALSSFRTTMAPSRKKSPKSPKSPKSRVGRRPRSPTRSRSPTRFH